MLEILSFALLCMKNLKSSKILIILAALNLLAVSCNRQSTQSDMWLSPAAGQAPKFENYAVGIYDGKLKAIDFSSNPEATMYRSRLSEYLGEKPNFAGHYIMAEIGCGSNCNGGMIIDAVDGKVYSAGVPTAMNGRDYRPDSTLQILNGSDYADNEDILNPYDSVTANLPVEYHVWEDYAFKLVYKLECSMENNKHVCRQQ